MSPLQQWRSDVVRVMTDAYPTLGGQAVSGYPWPTLRPHAPAIALIPGGGAATYLDYADASFCDTGHPTGRLMFMLSSQWDETAFDVLDEVASTVRLEASKVPVFAVERILPPGVVADLPDTLPIFLGLAVDISGVYPIN